MTEANALKHLLREGKREVHLETFASWVVTRLKLQSSLPSLFICVVVPLVTELEKTGLLNSTFVKNAYSLYCFS